MLVGRNFISIMDPSIPSSFTSLFEKDDSPQVGTNSTTPITLSNPHMSYSSYPPPNYNQHMYQPYYPPQPHFSNPSGSSGQNPYNYPPPFYPHHIIMPTMCITVSTHVTFSTILHHTLPRVTCLQRATLHLNLRQQGRWSG